MESATFNVSFEVSGRVDEATIYNLTQQLTDVIAAALEQRDIEIPDADVSDFDVEFFSY